MFKVATLVQLIVCVLFIVVSVDGDDKLRVIGGSESKRRHAFIISLQVYGTRTNFFGKPKGPAGWNHICGGSIIRKDCIVTAAHCVENAPKDVFSIAVGSNNLADNSSDRYYVRDYTIHSNYTALTKGDIAILRLNESMKFSDRVGPVKQSKQYVGANEKLLLIGWGHTNPLKWGAPPTNLKEMNTTSKSNDECNTNIQRASDGDICTYERPLKGACNGDSGGPLIQYREDEEVLIGIVSRGSRICSVGMPDVFTRASHFVEWIDEQCDKQ